MGIAFITAKAERFKSKREKEYEEQLASENLFSGLPDAIARTYRCKSTSDQLPAAGTMVLLYSSGSNILVLHLNQEIGTVMSPDASDVRALMKEAHTGRPPRDLPGLELYSGDDSMCLALGAAGAVGVIGVATHWATPEFQELFACLANGDLVGAREVNHRLAPTFDYSNSDTCVYAQSAKAALRVLGMPAGECRLPYGPAPEGTEDRAREVLRGLGRDLP